MASRIRRVAYFHTTVVDEPGEAYRVLTTLAGLGVNLLAFTAVPVGPNRTQLTVFPEDPEHMRHVAERAAMALDGPHPALLVQGDDELGAVAAVHERIYRAGVNIFATTAIADGQGHYGQLVYLRPEDDARAADALGI
jgi:hypothetical protein